MGTLQLPAQSELPGLAELPAQTQSTDLAQSRWRARSYGFLALAGLYLILGLNYPLISVTETRAAEVAREILVTGDWTSLHLNFEPYNHKPPLFYWLCALSLSTFGVNEFAARLVPALASWGTIWLTVEFASRRLNPRIGLLSGIVLFLSSGFLGLSRFLVIDPLFAFFCTATSFAGYEAIGSATQPSQPIRARVWMLVCGCLCGLGFLTKGPVIGVLCGVPFAYAVFVIHRKQTFHWISVLWAAVAFGVVVVPWIAWTVSRNPAYIYEFFWLHNVQRFSHGFHEEPFWYFIPILIAGAHPWSALFVPFFYRLSQRRPYQACSSQVLHYLLVTGSWCILFFSMSTCKLPTYILPAAAPLAITMAVYLVDLFSREATSRLERIAMIHAPLLALGGTIVAIIVYWVIAPVAWSETYRPWGTVGIAVAILACLLALGFAGNRSPVRWWVACIGVVLSFSIWLNHCLLPNVGQLTTCLGSGESALYQTEVNQAPQVITIGKPFYDAMFYSQRQSCRNYEKFEKAQLEFDLRRYQSLIAIVSADVNLESLLQQQPLALQRIFSHPRYTIYRIQLSENSPLKFSLENRLSLPRKL